MLRHKLTLTQIISGYLLDAQARRLSPNTIADYTNGFKKLQGSIGDPPFTSITPDQLRSFFASQPVSKKTLLNYHTALSSLWRWAIAEDLASDNPLASIPHPRPEKRAINPFTDDDLRRLVASCSKNSLNQVLPLADRNRAVLLLLLDTGMRASELADLKIHHLDLKNRRLRVYGKGSKERIIPISPRTAQSLWKYLASRPDEPLDRPLIVTQAGEPLDRDRLLKTLRSLGQRAGVPNCHPHRFRHTFAIMYLRNGGNPFTLQMLLGHTNLDTVRRYLAIAQSDLDANHTLASPVNKLKL